MVFKKACVIGVAIVAAAAMAQGTFVDGARGTGRARTADGHQGYFRFELAHYAANGQIRLGGSWWFTNVAQNANERFEITLIRLQTLGVLGHVAEFGGRAVLARMGPNGPIRREGNLVGRVEDRKQPGGTGDPDKYRFHFAADNNGPVVDFDGLVTDGDIVVRPHQ